MTGYPMQALREGCPVHAVVLPVIQVYVVRQKLVEHLHVDIVTVDIVLFHHYLPFAQGFLYVLEQYAVCECPAHRKLRPKSHSHVIANHKTHSIRVVALEHGVWVYPRDIAKSIAYRTKIHLVGNHNKAHVRNHNHIIDIWRMKVNADHLSIILNKDETFMDAKRGYVPKDKRDFSPTAVEKMRTASRHILYLINECYDLKSASTFVGNHYKLSERQRLAIARSIATAGQLAVRKAKEKSAIAGEEVWIDGFNTVITLEVMLSDSMLFSCMDGCIRDLAALRGTYRIIDETKDAVRILMDSLAEMNVSAAHILLDEPVSNSGRLKALIADIKEELRERCPFCLDIQLLKDVDRSLWQKANVITSDSIILDHCISWLNLMKSLIEQKGTKTLRVWEQS